MHANPKRRHLLLIATALLTAAALLAGGCAKQDLYDPPGSPYAIVGHVPLPSINEGVDVIGRSAFVAGGEAGLHTVDWTDPAAPQLLATLNTTKYADDVQVLRALTDGVLRDICHVVEGTEGVTSYDVTDPAVPVSYNTGTTAVVGRTIYIEQSDDPTEPYIVYLAEDWKGVRIFESVPADPGVLAYNGVFVGTNGKAYSLVVRDGWGYCADNEMGLCVLDLRILDLNAVRLASWADTHGTARAVALEGDYAFVADGVEGLAVFRIHEGDTPELVAHYDLGGFSEAIEVRDGLCALAANGGGVHFMDVRNPTDPIYLGTTPTSYATDVAFADDGHCIVVDEDDGLLVLGGRGPFLDKTRPGKVSDLTALTAGSRAIDLSWTMTGDDRFIGTAASLEIRMADAPILDEETWNAATPLTGLPVPEAPGTIMALTVEDLELSSTYHFAMKVRDDADQVSVLSNAASAATASGITLRNASLDIDGGTIDDTYTYQVEAIWEEAPFNATEVIIDGTPHTMTNTEGNFYSYQTTLPVGAHTYSFRFTSTGVPDAVTEDVIGPLVGLEAFTMGSPAGENGRVTDEVQHTVVLSNHVVAEPHEVTQAEWDAVMPAGSNPSQFVGGERPVDSVLWLDAIRYCNARSLDESLTPAYAINEVTGAVDWDREADGYRLPTEAEWEYLCRAGTSTALYSGDLVELNCRLDFNLDSIGWYCGNANDGTEVVGQKTANQFGLHDTSGNVREWCWDWYDTVTTETVMDPEGPSFGARRSCRGGSWYYNGQDCRSAARGSFPPDSPDNTVGFRVVRTEFSR
jgi:formylglycine-generating enzyme required for sulfatase activity